MNFPVLTEKFQVYFTKNSYGEKESGKISTKLFHTRRLLLTFRGDHWLVSRGFFTRDKKISRTFSVNLRT